MSVGGRCCRASLLPAGLCRPLFHFFLVQVLRELRTLLVQELRLLGASGRPNKEMQTDDSHHDDDAVKWQWGKPAFPPKFGLVKYSKWILDVFQVSKCPHVIHRTYAHQSDDETTSLLISCTFCIS